MTKQSEGPAEQIALDIRQHQSSVTDWERRDLALELHRWVKVFDDEFKLRIPSYPVFHFDRLRNVYGKYQPGRGAVGTKDNIRINTNELSRGLAQVLATLCHELLHLWQTYRGRRAGGNYHNNEFRAKARDCGLIVDVRGCHTGYTTTFTNLLERYGVDLAALGEELEAPALRLYGAAARPQKMKKWSCRCTKVRCATALDARCQRCGAIFELGEHVIGKETSG